MRCDAAERLLSARLDGEAGDDLGLDEHLASCPRCRAFDSGSRRIREVVRLEPAAKVPDLVPGIMAEVRRSGSRRRWVGALPAGGRYAAAFAAGALIAALIVNGLPGLRGPSAALATEIPREVAAASTEVTGYRATFDVLERHFHPRVPERRFRAEISFQAPERFGAVVTDLTSYPAGAWPRNDLALGVDEARWMARGPVTCPRHALPLCGGDGGVWVQRVTGREPFDGDAPLPTDIVLPVATLSGTDRVDVVGDGQILGRDVVVVELAYRDATPLFGYLHAAGSWRPLFPLDRVLVALDAENWFPLSYEVRAADSVDRRRWAFQNFLPLERPGSLLLRVEARTFSPGVKRPPALAPAPSARDEGFRDVPFPELTGIGATLLPAEPGGLRLHRAGVFQGGGRPDDEVLLAYTRGLAWLKIRQTHSWTERTLFGDMSDLAVPLRLESGGIVYYEPATASLGRRVSIHTAGIDVYLETNLPREDLLRVAGSLPLLGRPMPERWLVRRTDGETLELQATLAEAQRALPELALPAAPPPEYTLRTIHLHRSERGVGVAVYYRRPGAELDGIGIRVFQSSHEELAPPLDPDVQRVRLGDVVARYTPGRGLLEWSSGDTYRSVTAPTLDLAALVTLVHSMEGG
jgi:hypothetical protein